MSTSVLAMTASGSGGQRHNLLRDTGGSQAPSDAQYISSNCVVYTYYSDVGAVIDEHFSKALNSQQPSGNTFAGDKSKGKPNELEALGILLSSFESISLAFLRCVL